MTVANDMTSDSLYDLVYSNCYRMSDSLTLQALLRYFIGVDLHVISAHDRIHGDVDERMNMSISSSPRAVQVRDHC